MELHDLKPNKGAHQDRKRVGRGTAAGQGKTCGRGMKGQKSRAGGGVPLYHQGGNLPFYRKLPFKRGEGFTLINRVRYAEVNLEQLSGFRANSVITPEALLQAGIVNDLSMPVKILGRGEVSKALKFKVHSISKNAQEKIENAGGSIEIIQEKA
jgi:large subunit ribosomal protein L15